MFKVKISLLIAAAFLSFSCEAPRENPLDPAAENYRSIEGYVQTYSLPYSPMPDVSVYWAPSNTMAVTDNTGKFLIPNTTSSNGYLRFSKDGFRTDSVFINWGSLKNYNVQISMNKLPELDTSTIYSSVIIYADGSRTFDLITRVWISDVDKDIDSVIIENRNIGLRKSLDYDIINKFYELHISSDELDVNDIEETIGKDFNFWVIDISGKSFMIGKDRVTRVIRTGATVVSPDNNTAVDPLPTLTWKKFAPGYDLTYTVEVFKNDPGNPQLVVRNTSISMDSSSIKLKSSLAPANYFWVIWTTDSFNNNSRSKPATFTVR